MYFKGKKIQGIFYTSHENKTGMQFFRKGTGAQPTGISGKLYFIVKIVETIHLFVFQEKYF